MKQFVLMKALLEKDGKEDLEEMLKSAINDALVKP